MHKKCLFCNSDAESYMHAIDERLFGGLICPECGDYIPSRSMEIAIDYCRRSGLDYDSSIVSIREEDIRIVSCYLKETKNSRNINLFLDAKKWEEILDSDAVPHTIQDKEKKILLYVKEKVGLGRFVYVSFDVSYSNPFEFNAIVEGLIEERLINGCRNNDAWNVALTSKGMKMLEEL